MQKELTQKFHSTIILFSTDTEAVIVPPDGDQEARAAPLKKMMQAYIIVPQKQPKSVMENRMVWMLICSHPPMRKKRIKLTHGHIMRMLKMMTTHPGKLP